ncbi:flagellar basal body-associated protein FliL [Vibrio quintilis]|uniref:Flagellar protein FliL n=1 Tax=Vibrio quintilis TaxID=1117707 RepID=A0A1M7YX97_9VIBR|nr:flagellar basal body-associated protein FliL [Vibrio quintilis]SHO57212.1 flagellar basal body-associated protein FliL-like protein [Vibrio quintilis]
MLKRYFTLVFFIFSTIAAFPSHAEDSKDGPKLAYFTLEPDLTTNYFTKGKKLGYIQLRIEIMVADSKDLPTVEKHQPLIRDTIVEIMGKQTEDTIKSLSGREDLRKKLVKKLNDLLLPETGRPLIADLLFTKYIY